MRGSNMVLMLHRKTKYVSFKIKVVHTGHTLMIICCSIKRLVNSTQIGLNTSVSSVGKEASIITKKVQEHKCKSTKDTIDFMTFWIDYTYHEQYGPIDNKLCHGLYSMDYVILDMVHTVHNTDSFLTITSVIDV